MRRFHAECGPVSAGRRAVSKRPDVRAGSGRTPDALQPVPSRRRSPLRTRPSHRCLSDVPPTQPQPAEQPTTAPPVARPHGGTDGRAESPLTTAQQEARDSEGWSQVSTSRAALRIRLAAPASTSRPAAVTRPEPAPRGDVPARAEPSPSHFRGAAAVPSRTGAAARQPRERSGLLTRCSWSRRCLAPLLRGTAGRRRGFRSHRRPVRWLVGAGGRPRALGAPAEQGLLAPGRASAQRRRTNRRTRSGIAISRPVVRFPGSFELVDLEGRDLQLGAENRSALVVVDDRVRARRGICR